MLITREVHNDYYFFVRETIYIIICHSANCQLPRPKPQQQKKPNYVTLTRGKQLIGSLIKRESVNLYSGVQRKQLPFDTETSYFSIKKMRA